MRLFNQMHHAKELREKKATTTATNRNNLTNEKPSLCIRTTPNWSLQSVQTPAHTHILEGREME